MRVGIVGARVRTDRASVEAFVAGLAADAVVVSGGCRGVDRWAVAAARARGLEAVEHLPELAGARTRGEMARRYYARNGQVVADVDRLVAFVAPDRRGGTENTILQARRAGIPVEFR